MLSRYNYPDSVVAEANQSDVHSTHVHTRELCRSSERLQTMHFAMFGRIVFLRHAQTIHRGVLLQNQELGVQEQSGQLSSAVNCSFENDVES